VRGGKPAGLKTQEGIEALADVKPLSVSTDWRSEQSSEGLASGPGVVGFARLRGERCERSRENRSSDELGRLSVRETPCRVNLGRGSGMKQAQKVQGGVKRREREKR